MISFMASLSLIGDFAPSVPEITEYGNNRGTDFISTIAPAAQQMQANYGVHASISIAQAILESDWGESCLLYTSPSPRDATLSLMPSSA